MGLELDRKQKIQIAYIQTEDALQQRAKKNTWTQETGNNRKWRK